MESYISLSPPPPTSVKLQVLNVKSHTVQVVYNIVCSAIQLAIYIVYIAEWIVIRVLTRLWLCSKYLEQLQKFGARSKNLALTLTSWLSQEHTLFNVFCILVGGRGGRKIQLSIFQYYLSYIIYKPLWPKMESF